MPRTMLLVIELPSETLRATALEQAVSLYSPVGTVPFWASSDVPYAVLNTADLFLSWLRSGGQPFAVRVIVSEPQPEDDSSPPIMKGHAIMAVMNTSQKIKLTADPEDASGADVDVPVVFTSDNEAVATITDIPEDPKSVFVVSGVPGSAVVTATVTKLDGTEITGTVAIDVTTGDVDHVNIVTGEPEAE
jgi:hypothetical protein